MKACRVCGEVKPLEDFNRRADSPDGRRNDCNACRRVEKHAYYLRNRERILAHQKAKYDADPQFVIQRAKKWRQRNYSKMQAYDKAYRISHREQRSAAVRKWHQAHPERIRKFRRKSESKRRARKMALPYEDVDPQVVFERDGGICGICGKSVDPSAWHLDHVIPLAQGGPHTYANVQTAHPFCNISKGGRGHERQGVFK